MANASEIKQCRTLAGTPLYQGNGALLQAVHVVFLMQQRVTRLKVEQPIDANVMMAELKKLSSSIVYRKASNATDVCLFSFSDAAQPQRQRLWTNGNIDWHLSKIGQERERYVPFDLLVIAQTEPYKPFVVRSRDFSRCSGGRPWILYKDIDQHTVPTFTR